MKKKPCAYCNEPVRVRGGYVNPIDNAILHHRCAEFYMPESGNERKNSPLHFDNFPKIICEKCGGEMQKTTIPKENFLIDTLKAFIALAGLLLMLGGFVLIFLLPPVGFLSLFIGIFIYIIFRGEEPKKVCRCNNCGFFFERD